MKPQITKFYSAVLCWVLAALGFAGCSTNSGGDEYGTPYADFKVRGTTVDDQTKEPVKGLRVVLYHKAGDSVHDADTVYTDSRGEFEARLTTQPLDKLSLALEDVDQGLNGSYSDREVTVDFADVGYKGGKRWYLGEKSVDLGEVGMEEILPNTPNPPQS